MADYTCENCGKQLHLSDLFAGQTKTCVCGQHFVVPGSAPSFSAKLNNATPERRKRSNKPLLISGCVILAVVALSAVIAALRMQKTVTPEDFAQLQRGASLAEVRDVTGGDGEEVWTSTGTEAMVLTMTLMAPNAVAVNFIADEEKNKYLPEVSTDPSARANENTNLPSGYYRWVNGDGTGMHAVFLGNRMIWSMYVDEAMALLISEMEKASNE